MASQRDINAKMRAILVILEWPTVPSERTRCSTDPWNARARVRTPSFVRSSVREEPFRLVPSLDVTPPRRWRRPPWESSRALEDGLAALACYRSLWAFDHAECPWAASPWACRWDPPSPTTPRRRRRPSRLRRRSQSRPSRTMFEIDRRRRAAVWRFPCRPLMMFFVLRDLFTHAQTTRASGTTYSAWTASSNNWASVRSFSEIPPSLCVKRTTSTLR